MEAIFKYQSKEVKKDISKINSLDDLTKQIKELFKIKKDREIDIYILPENNYLKQSNFEELFLNRKNLVKGLSIFDVVDLAEKIKNIGLLNEIVPVNKIEGGDDSIEKTDSIVLNKNQIFKDKCTLCKGPLNLSKFGCLLCPNFFLCSKCEENHPHPMIKYKSNHLSDNLDKIIQIYSCSTKKEKKLIDKIKKKFGKKNIIPILLRTNIASNSFLIGPSQQRMVNLVIKNNNKFVIPKNTLSVIIKNQFDLNITIKDKYLDNEIAAGSEIPVTLYIRSNENNLFENYNLKIIVLSDSMDIVSEPLEMKIVVKNDDEDNELNKQFNEFPSIILLPKDKKKKLQYIIKEKLSVKSPQEIKAIMEKFKWSIDNAIVDLTN